MEQATNFAFWIILFESAISYFSRVSPATQKVGNVFSSAIECETLSNLQALHLLKLVEDEVKHFFLRSMTLSQHVS